MVLVKLALQALARELSYLFVPSSFCLVSPPQEIKEQVTGSHAHTHTVSLPSADFLGFGLFAL